MPGSRRSATSGLEVLEIVKKKNTSELWDASENLDVACEQCHASYWYPKEDAEFYRVLNKRLTDFSRSSSGGARRQTPGRFFTGRRPLTSRSGPVSDCGLTGAAAG